jgi:Flp pilus assembly protein TadG
MRKTWQELHSDESGGVAVIVTLVLIAMLMTSALVMDLGHLYTVRSETRKAAEAGAYAGARALGLPADITDWNWENGRATAVAAVQQNAADQLSLGDFTTANVQVGFWNMNWDPRTDHDLLPTNTPIVDGDGNVAAVKVTVVKKQGGAGSSAPVVAYFASVMGIDSMGVQSTAVAEISPPTTIPYTDAFPFALPFTWVKQHLHDNVSFKVAANQHIDSGGQWTSFKSTDNSASYIDSLLFGTVTGESITVGDDIYIQNGERASIYNVAQTRVGDIRYIPVVKDGFANGAFTTVKAYVPFEITYVNGSGNDPYVEGRFKPGWIDPKASGAGGIYFSDPLPPKMVQSR